MTTPSLKTAPAATAQPPRAPDAAAAATCLCALALLAALLACALSSTACKRAYMRSYADNITQIPNPDGSVSVLATPGGWNLTYHSFGLDTRLGSMAVTVATNKTFSITLDDWQSDVSTNDAAIVKTTLDGAAAIAEKAAAAAATSGGSTLAGASTDTLTALAERIKALLASRSTNSTPRASCTTNSDGAVTCP